MAVQDGYGKVSGSESLVFAFDLKDTTNSFKGQPATNIFLSGNPNGHGSGLEIIQTNYFLGKVIDSGIVYRNYVTNPAQSNTGTYYNNAGLNKGSMVFQALNANTEYIQISFDYYGVTPYVRHSNSGTGLNGYLGITSTDSTTDTYGWNLTYTSGSGDDWNNDINRMGYWQKISLIVDIRDDKTPSSISALYIYLDAATQGEGYFANLTVTEHVTFPSGPVRWVSGTRSNTQGLLDLTGNIETDLSNVSFNSTSQILFDGTDDYLPVGYLTDIVGPTPTEISFEIVAMANNLTGYSGIMGDYVGPAGTGFGIKRGGSDNKLEFRGYCVGAIVTSTTNIPIGQYFHAVITWSNLGQLKIYFNGILETTANGIGTTWNHGLGILRIGDIYNSMGVPGEFNGTIPVVKIYNRVLTSTEISNNYLKYKRQYGLT
jgi:hypothetical protein